MESKNIIFFRVENGLRNIYLANELDKLQKYNIKIVHYNELYLSDYENLLKQKKDLDSGLCWSSFYRKYKNTIMLSDVEKNILEIQKQYNINLSRAIFAERHIQSLDYEEMTTMIYLFWRFLEKIEKEYPDFIYINCNLEHLHDVIAYYFCKAKELPVIIVQDLWKKGYVGFSIDSMHSVPTGFMYDDLKLNGKKPDLEDIENIILGKIPPIGSSQVDKKNILVHIFNLIKLSLHLGYGVLKNYQLKFYFFPYDFLNIIRDKTLYIKRKIFREWNSIKNSLFIKTEENPSMDERFYYYPIHYQPEVSTLIWGYYYVDQVHFIKNLARCLPVGIKLYVKDHKANYGYRATSDYTEIKKIPNVVLVSHDVNNEKLIENAECLVTINGSAALERLKYKRPYFIFGDGRFKYIFHDSYVNGFKELENRIKNNDFAIYNEDTINDYSKKLWDSIIISDVMSIPARQVETNFRTDYCDFAKQTIDGLESVLNYIENKKEG